MKGTCYGGPLYLPSHPDSDCNGLLRCVIRTKSWIYAESAIESLSASYFKVRSLFESKLWKESESAVQNPSFTSALNDYMKEFFDGKQKQKPEHSRANTSGRRAYPKAY